MSALASGFTALLRDWRAGELNVLMLAVIVGISALSSVALFTSRIAVTVQQQAAEVLAADLVVSSSRPLSEDIATVAQEQNLQQARVTSFPSVAFAGDSSTLVAVKAVDEMYPLRGRLRVADRLFGSAYPVEDVPRQGEAWAEARLLARLGIDTGGRIRLGALELTVTRVADYIPDQGFRFVDLAPTLIINIKDLPASDLVRPGSRISYTLLLAGSASDLAAARSKLAGRESEFLTLRDLDSARPEIRDATRRARQFLGLAALVSAFLSAVAVAMAARRYAARQLDTIALMKCMGASQSVVLRQGLVRILVLALVTGLLGSLIGYSVQQGLSWWLRELVQGVLPAPALSAWMVGPAAALILLLGFALPPLLELRRVSPMRVLRRDLAPPQISRLLVYGLAAVAYLLAVFWMAGDLRMLLLVTGINLAAVLVLGLAGWALVALVGRLRRGMGVAWRYGLANIARRGPESVVQLIGFGLGLMVMLLLTVTRDDLMAQWRATLPDNAPNHFMINIQPAEKALFTDTVVAHGLPAPQLSPLVRARLQSINDVPVADMEFENDRGRRWVQRERNLTWSATLQEGNQIVSGHWWEQGPGVAGQVSVEEEFADQLGLKLGDRVGFDLSGEQVQATVTSLRKVRWDSFRPNFFMVLSPGTVDDSMASYITSLHLGPGQRDLLLELARVLPGVTVFDVDAILSQVRGVMDKASLAVQYVFMFTVLAGVMVLVAAVQATRDERRYESAMLRTLGASRRVVLMGVLTEFGVLGMLSGLLGAAGASLASYLLATRVFELQGHWDGSLWLLGMVAGTLLVGLSGLLATRSVVSQPPVLTLRGDG
jgi:putative ABC transport system permease protein